MDDLVAADPEDRRADRTFMKHRISAALARAPDARHLHLAVKYQLVLLILGLTFLG